GDSDAKAFIVSSRFAEACKRAADEVGFPSASRLAAGSIEGFRDFESFKSEQRATLPEDRAAGQVMNYTSGTTGRPKGVRRALAPFDPDAVFSMYAMFLAMFGIPAGGKQVHLVGSPLYHTA